MKFPSGLFGLIILSAYTSGLYCVAQEPTQDFASSNDEPLRAIVEAELKMPDHVVLVETLANRNRFSSTEVWSREPSNEIDYILSAGGPWRVLQSDGLLVCRDPSIDIAFGSDPLDRKIGDFSAERINLDAAFDMLTKRVGGSIGLLYASHELQGKTFSMDLRDSTLQDVLVVITRKTGMRGLKVMFNHKKNSPGAYPIVLNFVH